MILSAVAMILRGPKPSVFHPMTDYIMSVSGISSEGQQTDDRNHRPKTIVCRDLTCERIIKMTVHTGRPFGREVFTCHASQPDSVTDEYSIFFA